MKRIFKKIRIPKSSSEITTEWLDNVLSKVSKSKLSSIKIDESFGPWSLLGKAVRLKLNWMNKKCVPKSVIVKFQVNCSDPKKEGKIYHLLSRANIAYVPRLYGVFGNGNLVMEDLTPTHSVLKNFTITQVRSVVSLLADVNSRFWKNPLIPRDDPSHFINSVNINFEQGWDAFKNRYQKQLGKEIVSFEWVRKNPKIIASQYNSGPTTLSHGDVNRGNLLFSNDGKSKPILIDWQLAGHKVIPFDLSYFLVKTLAVKQRKKYENILLNEYYELLPSQIQKYYTFEKIVLNYRACVTRSMLSAVTRMGPKFDSHPNRFKAADKLAFRVIEAVRDLDPVGAIQELKKNG